MSKTNLYIKTVSTSGNFDILRGIKKPDSALGRLRHLKEIRAQSFSHDHKIKEAAQEIFENYTKKRNSFSGKITTFFHALREKCFCVTNKRKKEYQLIQKVYAEICKPFEKIKPTILPKPEIPKPITMPAPKPYVFYPQPVPKPIVQPKPVNPPIQNKKPLVDVPKKTLQSMETLTNEAFKLFKDNDKPEFDITPEEIRQTLVHPDFNGLNRDGKTQIRDLIFASSQNGFPIILNEEERLSSAFRLRYILFQLGDKSTLPKAPKEIFQKRLAASFYDCQTVQYEAVTNLYNELNKCDTLDTSFKIQWEKYKSMAFDQWIAERHPETKNPQQTQDQFPHIKNAYLISFADSLGIPGKLVAEGDDKRTSEYRILKGQRKETLIEDFKKHLKIDDFVQYLCQDINDKDEGLIKKALIYKWGKAQNKHEFGYYSEKKNYKGLAAPTEEQKDCTLPYISPNEVKQVLIEVGLVKKDAPKRTYIKELKELKKQYKDNLQEELKRLRDNGTLLDHIEHDLDAQLIPLEEYKNSDEPKHNELEIKVAIGRALEIKKIVGKTHYVFTHAQDARWVVLTYLIKEIVRENYTKEDLQFFKFLRPPKKEKAHVSEFQNLYADANHPELISADAYFLNTFIGESAINFLARNYSVASKQGKTYAIHNCASNILQLLRPNKANDAIKQSVSKFINEIGVARTGVLHTICVPKHLAQKPETDFQFRSHPYGLRCHCELEGQGKDLDILEFLNEDVLSEELNCIEKGNRVIPQFRLLTSRLDPKDDVFVITQTPFTKHKRNAMKQEIRNFLGQ